MAGDCGVGGAPFAPDCADGCRCSFGHDPAVAQHFLGADGGGHHGGTGRGNGLDLAGALEIFAQPKYGGRRTAATPLKEFGEDPASGLAVVAKTGQFGLYVTDGAVNATVPKDENLEEMSPDQAFELLAIRREKLGLEPGQAPAKAGKPAKKVGTTRVVKRGTTRKKK